MGFPFVGRLPYFEPALLRDLVILSRVKVLPEAGGPEIVILSFESHFAMVGIGRASF